MPYTTTEIRSHSTGKLYAPKNAYVTVIREGIVEHDGFRFPCTAERLSEMVVDEQTEHENKLPHAQTRRATPSRAARQKSTGIRDINLFAQSDE